MTIEDFKKSLTHSKPPENISKVLLSLWYDGKGDWEASHDIAQDIHDEKGSLIHAFLHRKEGDLSNASYWYSKAGRRMPDHSIKEEWEGLVMEFLHD